MNFKILIIVFKLETRFFKSILKCKLEFRHDLNRQWSESIITVSAVRGIISIGSAVLFT